MCLFSQRARVDGHCYCFQSKRAQVKRDLQPVEVRLLGMLATRQKRYGVGNVIDITGKGLHSLMGRLHARTFRHRVRQHGAMKSFEGWITSAHKAALLPHLSRARCQSSRKAKRLVTLMDECSLRPSHVFQACHKMCIFEAAAETYIKCGRRRGGMMMCLMASPKSFCLLPTFLSRSSNHLDGEAATCLVSPASPVSAKRVVTEGQVRLVLREKLYCYPGPRSQEVPLIPAPSATFLL